MILALALFASGLTGEELLEEVPAPWTIDARHADDLCGNEARSVRLGENLFGGDEQSTGFSSGFHRGVFAHPRAVGLTVNARAAHRNHPAHPSVPRPFDQIPGTPQIHFPVGIRSAATRRNRAYHRIKIARNGLQICGSGEVAGQGLDTGGGHRSVRITLSAQAQNLGTGRRQSLSQRQAHIPTTDNQDPHLGTYH
jgi:hypothetical protein